MVEKIKLLSGFETQCCSLCGRSMQPSWSLQLLILTILSLSSLTSCHPHPHDVPAVKVAAIPAKSIQEARNLVGNHGPTDVLAVRSFKRRSIGFHEFLDIGRGWNMYYSSWPAAALPVQPAAWALTHLYATMLQQARGKWTSSPPQYGLTVTYGGLQLVMQCAEKPIPWLFVGNFAEKLLRITEGGWTGLYVFMLSQAETEVSIVVQLSVSV